ncbi:MAG: ABC transporter ATP-binding protein [Parvibaculaceae bacterium]
MSAALEMAGISKSFDKFPALRAAEFSAFGGEVHALLGENGAGKSTLMNIAAGLYTQDAGQVLIGGKEVFLSGPLDAIAHRIGMVHQHFKLVRTFTAVENVMLAGRQANYRVSMRETRQRIRQLASELGFAFDPDRAVAELSVAEQQRIEIVKVLSLGATVLILDEPTAVLTDQESHRLLSNVRSIASRGTAVVLVTHKLADVRKFTDRVTVMRGGRTCATMNPKDVTAEQITRLMVGDEVASPKRERQGTGAVRLNVSALQSKSENGVASLHDATFSVRAGEIYGIAGVGGNGQTELAEILMGIRPPSAGAIELSESGDIARLDSGHRRRLGFAMIPADRYRFGLAGELSVMDNICMGELGRYGSWVMNDTRLMADAAEKAVKEFDIHGVRSVRQRAGLLSGGNAQKVVLAREFAQVPKVIVAHSPSRGLDVRACAAVHRRLIAACDAGAAGILISEDLDEVLGLSDRIGVMSRGRIVAEFSSPADRGAVGKAMVDHV